MKYLFLISLLFSFNSFGIRVQCGPKPEQPLFKTRTTLSSKIPSIVTTKNMCGYGCSGVIIAKGFVLTAAHCVDTPFVFVTFYDKTVAAGYVIDMLNYDGLIADDLAIVRTDTADIKPQKIACSLSCPSKGKIVACGGDKYPEQQEMSCSFLMEMNEEPNKPFILVKSPVDHGDSGGPALNEKGEIVGIVSELELKDPSIGKLVPLSSIQKITAPFVQQEDNFPFSCPNPRFKK